MMFNTESGIRIGHAAKGSDFEIEVYDDEEGKTYYIKDKDSLMNLLEGAVPEQDSGITVEKW